MDNRIFIIDDNGKEKEMCILFTFDMNEKNYAIVYEDGDPDTVYAFEYDSEGNLNAVEDDETLEEIEEIVAAFDGIEDEEED